MGNHTFIIELRGWNIRGYDDDFEFGCFEKYEPAT